jgi:serine/threonine protein kinase
METFGQYVLLEKVGTGGMAELFKAKKLGIEGFERVLAIKRILPHLSSDEEFIDMFIAEAKLVARLTHKNIAQVYDFGKTGQDYFIAMEYVWGKDLKAILKKCKDENLKLPLPLAAFIAKEVASALSYAHRQKDSTGKNLHIIHRDVSPQNILISYEGEVKVVDFGIAKAGALSRTITGTLKGKLSYMSPEQAWGKPIDHRSDIFSLGIVLYEMLTGERLFKGDTELNTLERVREAKVEVLPSFINANVPSELEAKALKALAKEAADRYQVASDMEAALGDTLLKLSSSDPIVSLKQFMHRLFKTEIDAECKSEMQEETISIRHEQEPVPLQAEKEERQPPPKRTLYPYILSASLVFAIIIATFIFWPSAGKKATAPVSGQPPPVHMTEQKTVEPSTDKQQVKVQKVSAEEGEGELTVNAIPWANVYIDGKPYGTTPKTVEDVKAGEYTIRLENPKFPAWERKFTVSKGKATKISHKFGGFGKLIINATPWGEVYLDGTLIGQTPLTVDAVPASRHTIKVSREGYEEFSKTLEIKEGSTERLSVRFSKEGEQ